MNNNIFFGGNTESNEGLYIALLVLIICLVGCGTAGYNRLE